MFAGKEEWASHVLSEGEKAIILFSVRKGRSLLLTTHAAIGPAVTSSPRQLRIYLLRSFFWEFEIYLAKNCQEARGSEEGGGGAFQIFSLVVQRIA